MYMRSMVLYVGAKKNRLFKYPQHIWLKTFQVYIPVFYSFLSIVTFLINSRERQLNYRKKLPSINSFFFGQ